MVPLIKSTRCIGLVICEGIVLGANRTRDLLLRRQPLYPLSYENNDWASILQNAYEYVRFGLFSWYNSQKMGLHVFPAMYREQNLP